MLAVVQNGSTTCRNAVYFSPEEGWRGFRIGRSGTLAKYELDPSGDAMRDKVMLVRYTAALPAFARLLVGRWAWLLKLRPSERFQRDYEHYCPHGAA